MNVNESRESWGNAEDFMKEMTRSALRPTSSTKKRVGNGEFVEMREEPELILRSRGTGEKPGCFLSRIITEYLRPRRGSSLVT